MTATGRRGFLVLRHSANGTITMTMLTIQHRIILFYGVESCPTNSSIRQSFEFTMNKILFKVFSAMSKDSYSYIYEWTSLFVNVRTSLLINSVHQIIYYVVWYIMAGRDWREFWIVFSFP